LILDTFVKVYLVGGGKRLKKKKTSARKNTNNPVWNEAVSFSIPSSSLSTAAIEVCSNVDSTYRNNFFNNVTVEKFYNFICNSQICVLDQSNDLMGSNALVGTVVVGPRETGTELSHWNDMSQNFRKSIAMWHVLT